MIRGKILVCLLLLATANYMLAQESQQDETSHDPGQDSNGPGQDNELSQNQEDGDQSGSGEEFESPQSRFFFSSFFNTRLISCNYTSQAGVSCANCRQVLRCFSGDVGTLRTCRGFFPYCNNGRCSLYQEANCTSVG